MRFFFCRLFLLVNNLFRSSNQNFSFFLLDGDVFGVIVIVLGRRCVGRGGTGEFYLVILFVTPLLPLFLTLLLFLFLLLFLHWSRIVDYWIGRDLMVGLLFLLLFLLHLLFLAQFEVVLLLHSVEVFLRLLVEQLRGPVLKHSDALPARGHPLLVTRPRVLEERVRPLVGLPAVQALVPLLLAPHTAHLLDGSHLGEPSWSAHPPIVAVSPLLVLRPLAGIGEHEDALPAEGD